VFGALSTMPVRFLLLPLLALGIGSAPDCAPPAGEPRPNVVLPTVAALRALGYVE
jgi:hypothetical protein